MKQIKQLTWTTIIIWGLILGSFFVYLSLCFNQNVHTDEAFTMGMIHYNSFAQLISKSAADVHPPLYYLIGEAASSILGPSLLVQKLVVILPVILTAVLGAVKIRKEFGDYTAMLFIAFVCFVPCTMIYAIQVRMYSWGLFFVTLCGVYAYDFYKNGSMKSLVITLTGGLLAAYIHNFSFGSAMVIYGLLFWAIILTKRELLLKWFILVVVSFIGYFPWFRILLRQIHAISGSYWIPPIDGKTILSYFKWAFGTDTPYSAVMYVILFGFSLLLLTHNIVTREKRQDSIYGILCGLVLVITFATGIIVSWIMNPIFVARYAYPSMGLLGLSLAIGFRKVDRRTLFLIMTFICLTGAMQYQVSYREEYKTYKSDQTQAYLEANMKETDQIIFNFSAYEMIYDYYYHDRLVYVENVDLFQTDTYWYFDTFSYLDIPDEVLQAYGLTKEYIGAYGVEGNDFDLYKFTRK